MYGLTQFASGAAGGDIFTALGIDWKTLILQMLGFLLLVWLMGKYVYPPLIKAVDNRQDKIEESTRAAVEAEQKAVATQAEITELMHKARLDADEVIASAKAEASNMVDEAEKKSRERAERIVADAEAEISKNVAAAKKSLRAETLGLVAEATEKVVGKVVTNSVDKKVVAEAVKEAEQQ